MSMLPLSYDNINTILSFLNPRDLVIIRGVSRSFFQVSKNPEFWKTINISDFNSNMSKVVQLFRCLFLTRDEPGSDLFTSWRPFVENIIVPNSVRNYTESEFEVLADLFPSVKRFSLECIDDSYSDIEIPGRKSFNVPRGIFDKLQSWDLESVEFTGDNCFDTTQDYLESFFKSQPSLQHFRCDFDIFNFRAKPPQIRHRHSIIYYASLYCKKLKTFKAPLAEFMRGMEGDFKDLEIPFAEVSMSPFKFRSTTSAIDFAKCFTSLETLHLTFYWLLLFWEDVNTAIDHLVSFVNSLPRIKVLNIIIDTSGTPIDTIRFQSSTLERVNIKYID